MTEQGKMHSYRRLGRRLVRTGVIVVSGTLLGLTVVGAVAQVNARRSESPDPGVQAILDSQFKGYCVTSSEAVVELNASLKSAGYDTWQVTSRASGSSCVAGGIDPHGEAIILFPVQSPSVTAAMHGVQADLMTRCLNKDEAVQFLSSVLTGADVRGFEVQTDTSFTFPNGQQKEVEEHIANGCYVYSGSGHDAEGTPLYFLSGIDG